MGFSWDFPLETLQLWGSPMAMESHGSPWPGPAGASSQSAFAGAGAPYQRPLGSEKSMQKILGGLIPPNTGSKLIWRFTIWDFGMLEIFRPTWRTWNSVRFFWHEKSEVSKTGILCARLRAEVKTLHDFFKSYISSAIVAEHCGTNFLNMISVKMIMLV